MSRRLWPSNSPAWRISITLTRSPRAQLRQWRLLSTQSSVEHVRVRCASSGEITVSLHNISKHDSSTPLVVFIPPFSQAGPDYSPTPLPSCFHDYPVAVINYRWQASEGDGDDRPAIPLQWPTPLHDVNFGYSWITANLGSAGNGAAGPRPAYVYGSYLGASLAAGLALTESHVPARPRPMTVRGLIAHNGIYNWTTFLPDHPIHRLRTKSRSRGRKHGLLIPSASIDDRPVEEGGIFTELKRQTPGLFANPSNLFDPFASACLFFHSANLHVPEDFTTPLSASAPLLNPDFTAAIDALANGRPPFPSPTSSPSTASTTSEEAAAEEEEEETASTLLSKAALLAKQLKPPRKGYLVFPPRDSTLRLPHTLFLYDQPYSSTTTTTPTSSSSSTTGPAPTPPRTRRRAGAGGTARSSAPRNSFRAQAADLAGLMLRSLDMHELRARRTAPWEWEGEAGGAADWAGAGWGGGGGGAGDEEDARRRAMERRVQSFEIAPNGRGSSSGGGLGGFGGLGRDGEEVVAEWLRERIDEDFGEEVVGVDG
ncbi:8727af47-5ac1-4d8b-bd99-ce24126bf854 [Thermothielavioides terrestris]|uniref:8727af47-5ac1-4d8b-bd99-ce24126bf854 n=1 Tax=Thermothielavioides terrestris TaxID=2587410 RepID=A0A3S4EZQ5_9PEZI|nr:8727af47-5ac1-4d8b-bd99-ce24126bf854 [Thermothielavioides terrestris]